MVFISIGAGFGGGVAIGGYFINHLDIAPRFAGVLMGITNTAGILSGIIGPVIAKTIAQKVIYLATLIAHKFLKDESVNLYSHITATSCTILI